MSEELELKFSFQDAEALRAWLDKAFPPRAGAAWRTVEIRDRYFDTADSALAGEGYGARLRTVEGATVLNLKRDVAIEDDLHRRLEIEGPAGASLQPADWPASPATELVLAVAAGRRLVERFVIGLQRRERVLGLPDASVVLALDDAEVEALGLAAGTLRELEVELVEGDEAALARLSQRIRESGLVGAAERSKLVGATRLAEQAARVMPDDAWSDAARKVLRRHLLRLVEREAPTRAGDPVALKQMRVASRRLRATWRLFEGAFGRADGRRFETGLRRVARALGSVRDPEVLLGTLSVAGELEALGATWRHQRDGAFERLIELLDSAEYARFIDDHLGTTARRARWTPGRLAAEPVGQRAAERLEQGLLLMTADAAAAEGSNKAVLWHALRISAKRMRYSLEAFRDILDPEPTTDFIEHMRSLQDVLGEMNDASVAVREAAAWLLDGGPDAAPAERAEVALYIAERERIVARTRAEFAPVWATVADLELPRVC